MPVSSLPATTLMTPSTSSALSKAIHNDRLSRLTPAATPPTPTTTTTEPPPRFIPEEGRPGIQTELSHIQFAVDSDTQAKVVLKTLTCPATAAHELAILDQLATHNVPHTLRLITTFTSNNASVLVFPRLQPFDHHHARLDLVRIAHLTRQLATSLAAIHALGIVHLDLSLANLMLAPTTNNICIIDWGLARSQQPPPPLTPLILDSSSTDTYNDDYDSSYSSSPSPSLPPFLLRSSSCLSLSSHHSGLSMSPSSSSYYYSYSPPPPLPTTTSATEPKDYHPLGRGTPGYIAPEMYSGTATGTAPDIFSLGIILGQMLEPYLPDCQLSCLGSKLARSSTTADLVAARIRDHFDTQRTGYESPWTPIIAQAAHLLLLCLDHDPTSRPTAHQILQHPFLTASSEEFNGTDYASRAAEYLRLSICGSSPRDQPKIVVRYR
ncbi:kinase-like domain-containing protein [Phlyctochytrium arcticum]|nr:kinase-like domain-containing protein [Phlyctochytrium arcticum]